MTPPLRQVVLALTAVLALAVVCAVAWTPRPRAEGRPAEAPLPASLPASPPGDPIAPPEAPMGDVRNVFEFMDRTTEAPPPAPLPALVIPPPLDPGMTLTPAAEEPIRLVGFVRRGGALRAAVSLAGRVAVLAPGEEADGYSLLAVDEDTGATVRMPDGSELVLSPPQP